MQNYKRKMSNNNRKTSRQTRNSNKSAAGGSVSHPASPNQPKFSFSVPPNDTNGHESIWTNYRQQQNSSDKRLQQALNDEKALDFERTIINDTYGSPSNNPTQPKSKDKAKENPKSVMQNQSRDQVPKLQQIVNNLDGTSKIPQLNKETVSTNQNDQQQLVDNPNLVNNNQQNDQGTSHMDVDPGLTNKENSVITIEKGKEYVAIVPYGELLGESDQTY
jgi:hypothetical protein